MTLSENAAPPSEAHSLWGVINAEQLSQLERLPAQDVIELVALYRQSSANLIDQLRRSLELGDVGGVKLVAHTLLGSSANLAGGRFPQLCAEVEKAALAGQLDAVRALLPSVYLEQAAFLDALSRHLDEMVV